MTEPSPPAARDVPPKSTLFCPDCGHQSRCTGDWIRFDRADETHVACPDCGATIQKRPTFDDRRPDALWQHVWDTWDAGIQAWQAVWRQMVGVY